MRRGLKLICFCLAFVSTGLAEDEVVVPRGVRYKKAAKDANERAKVTLRKAFGRPDSVGNAGEVFVERMAMCRPMSWQKIRHLPEMKNITKGRIVFDVPIWRDGKIRERRKLEGKLFQTPEQVAAFWRVLSKVMDRKGVVRIQRRRSENWSSTGR